MQKQLSEVLIKFGDYMNKAIVIIDREQKAAEIIRDILNCHGFTRVATYCDTVEAFRSMLKTGLPDLIITNYEMPIVNGVQLLEELAFLHSKNVPGIILAADAADVTAKTDKYRVLEKGVPEFFFELTQSIVDILSPDGVGG